MAALSVSLQHAPRCSTDWRCHGHVEHHLEQAIANRLGKKANTIRICRRSLYFVKQFFGDCQLISVTIGQAEKFKAFLLTPKRKDGGKKLCENTARKMLDKLKTVFSDAIKDELLTKKPFKGIASNVTGNPKRERFIEQATIEQVIEYAPDDEFAFIIVQSRYGGLPTPSEFSLLKHGDFKLREDAPDFEVFAPKTEYCKPEPRIVPVFPELLPYVKKLVSKSKAKAKQNKGSLCSAIVTGTALRQTSQTSCGER